jgi:hypothetical protein
VLRACRRGFKIGPLFADDPHIAGTLFQGLASRVISRLGLPRALMTICSRCLPISQLLTKTFQPWALVLTFRRTSLRESREQSLEVSWHFAQALQC